MGEMVFGAFVAFLALVLMLAVADTSSRAGERHTCNRLQEMALPSDSVAMQFVHRVCRDKSKN